MPKNRLRNLIRTLQQQRRQVFVLARTANPNADTEDVEAAQKLAAAHIKEIGEECLLQDLPLVVACMQSQVLGAYIKQFQAQEKNGVIQEEEYSEEDSHEAAAEAGSEDGGGSGDRIAADPESDADDHAEVG